MLKQVDKLRTYHLHIRRLLVTHALEISLQKEQKEVDQADDNERRRLNTDKKDCYIRDCYVNSTIFRMDVFIKI